MAAGSVPIVTGLSIFPIKSCKAVSVEEIEIDSHGVVGDRRLMLVNGKGRFISQRQVSKLATVTARFVDEGGKRLVHVSAPGMARDLKFEPKLEGERINVSVWDSYDVKAVDQGDEPAQWFSDLVGVGSTYNRLIASAENVGDEFQRLAINVPPELKGKLPAVKMVLQDDGPVSLISAESLADLNWRLKERTGNELPLKRFRMNIEISGCSRPFEEDEWLEVKIGSVPFTAYANAERCKMTGIDQESGETDKLGPLEILRGYRAPHGPTHAMFGQLLVPVEVGGKVRVGDSVQVLRKKTMTSAV